MGTAETVRRLARAVAAEATLERLGYVWKGGDLWEPPATIYPTRTSAEKWPQTDRMLRDHGLPGLPEGQSR